MTEGIYLQTPDLTDYGSLSQPSYLEQAGLEKNVK